ncbi:MAG: hypothetical protein ABSA41_09180 [Terriglobia bacterium]|jgi:hypothetical protein
MEEEIRFLYGGISGVELAAESFELGEGVVLRRTYAHLMSPCIMAFARPGPHRYHPGPWKAAKGGFGYDIEVEVRSPPRTCLGDSFDARKTIWWIAALLRLAKAPFLSVPVLSDHPFQSVPGIEEECTLQPFETEQRLFQVAEPSNRVIEETTLSWVKEKWIPAGNLLSSNSKFYTAFRAFDCATVRGPTSPSLLALWGGLEQLFAPSPGELRFRVACLLASYLEQQGSPRFDLYKQILTLYNERSVAAHTAQEIDTGPLLHTYVLMRNALLRMIDENKVPTQADLEALLFGCEDA